MDIELPTRDIIQSQADWKPFPIHLGTALRCLRLRRGLSQSTLARMLRISRSELSKAETGRVVLPFRTVLLIAIQLGADHVTIRVRDLSP
jgi:transcriptional regulator with XRE-family HTH domain